MTKFEFYLVTILCLSSISNSKKLVTIYSSTKLRSGGSCHRLHYDGNDSIFIVGSCSSPFNKQVFKYSLASDKISQVATLSKGVDGSSIVGDGDGHIFIFKQSYRGDEVLVYNTVTGHSATVARMPTGCPPQPPLLFWDNETALAPWENNTKSQVNVPGEGYTFKYFHFKNHTFTDAGGEFPIYISGGGVARVGERTFYFPFDHHGNGSVFELESKNLKLSPVGQPNLPQISWLNSVVTDGKFVYVIAGFHPEEINVKITSGEGILRFDPETNSTDFIPLENWPVGDGERYYFAAPQCAFVNKLNRIYCFGGTSYEIGETDFRQHDEIFYMELNNGYITTSLKLEN